MAKPNGIINHYPKKLDSGEKQYLFEDLLFVAGFIISDNDEIELSVDDKIKMLVQFITDKNINFRIPIEYTFPVSR